MTKRKSVWLVSGALLVGLAILSLSCAVIEPPNPSLPVAQITPPRIPHSLEGRADCRLCHEKGLGGAPQFPADHASRPSEVCITCHIKPPANGTPQAAAPAAHTATPATPAVPPTQPTQETQRTPQTPPATTTPAAVSAKDLYTGKCAACHGINREGGFGPALTPESLATRPDDQLNSVISDGKAGTAMPPFKSSFKPEEIDALVQFIKSAAP